MSCFKKFLQVFSATDINWHEFKKKTMSSNLQGDVYRITLLDLIKAAIELRMINPGNSNGLIPLVSFGIYQTAYFLQMNALVYLWRY